MQAREELTVYEREERQRRKYHESLDVQRRVRSLAKLKDSHEWKGLLSEIAEEIEEKWLTEDPDHYARLMLDVVNNLTWLARSDYGSYRATTEKYAIETLEKAERIPANIEFDLLRYVRPKFDEAAVQLVDERSVRQERRRKILRWLDAWKRLEQAIDPDWDPEDLPFENIAPPIGTGLPSGVCPRAIKDPELRAEYEAAIEANRKKNEEYKRQRMLRKVKRRFSPRLEKTIVTAYSRPPHDMKELAQFVRIYIEDQPMRERIEEAVQKNVSSN